MATAKGIIMLWSGAAGDIPAGWILCNGAGGSPDLRNKFVVGAGDTYAPGASGGDINHTHTFTGAGHSHTIEAGAELAAGTDLAAVTSTNPAAGTTEIGSSMPPYFALCYIYKT